MGEFRLTNLKCALALAATVSFAPSIAAAMPTLMLERISTSNDVSSPVYAAAPPGDDTRLFVLNQFSGGISIYDRTTGSYLPDPFVIVPGLGFEGFEQGAQSFAFAPDYDTSGKFYVSVINADGDHQVIEYMVSGDPNVADAASARTIITVDHPDDGATGHYGGWIGFSPNDGYLYVSTGDSNADPINDISQLNQNQLGSILRIDPRADAFPGDDMNNYAAPADNPFVGVDGDDAVWAFGLRNPFRPAFDPDTGALLIADVGEDLIEEINVGIAGANYGWPGYEGSVPFDLNLLTGDTSNLQFPVYEYEHGTDIFEGFSVTGGGFYSGPIAELDGLYFFGDFVNATIWSFRFDELTNSISELTAWAIAVDQGALNNLASFGFDGNGNMYVMDNFGGDIFLVASAISDVPLPASIFLMGAGLAGLFRATRKKRP